MPARLSVSSLTKYYGEFCAVNNLSFKIEKGEILGLLGPNGAGKSTTIQMLLGLTTPDSGTVSFFGKNLQEHRSEIAQEINYGSTYSEVQGRLTVWQNLRIYAGFYQVAKPGPRIAEMMKLMEIEHLHNQQFWQLSSGQKTRVLLAKALLNYPKVLLLDEPTASLDPEIVTKIIALIQKLRNKYETAVLFTSHNMEEVARLCDEVMFLHKGNLVLQDSPQRLARMIDQSTLGLNYDGPVSKITTVLKKAGLTMTEPKAQVALIKINDKQIPTVLYAIQQAGIIITHIDITQPNLEDVFLHLSVKGTDGLVTN